VLDVEDDDSMELGPVVTSLAKTLPFYTHWEGEGGKAARQGVAGEGGHGT